MLDIDSCTDTRVQLLLRDPENPGVTRGTVTLTTVARVRQQSPPLGEMRAFLYGLFVPTLAAVALVGLLCRSLTHSRWLTFFVTLVGLPLLGGLLGAGYGGILDAFATKKDLWIILGMGHLVLCLPVGLVLAIVFTWMARPRPAA